MRLGTGGSDMADVKHELATHLVGLGYEFNVPRRVIFQKLRRKMGEARFRAVFAGAVAGSSTARKEEFYSRFEDLEEGNLMRSLEAGAALETSLSLYRECSSHLVPGARVMELGCWTGGLVSFIATRHPGCSVVGVDLAGNVLAACTSYYKLPNLQFRTWNYKYPGREDIEPADVLLCSMGVVHQWPENTTLPDPNFVRRSPEYALQFEEALNYLRSWRRVARDGAALFAVLRLALYPRFLAWTDAAQQAGWTPRLDRLWHVDLPDEQIRVPGLVFEAKPCAPLPEEAVLDRWGAFDRRGHFFGRLAGGAALAAYRAMTGKVTLAERRYRRGTLLTHDVVGLAGGMGFVFTQDAVAKYRLLLLASSKARELAAGVSGPVSQVPITDGGEFQPSGTAGAPPRPGYVVQTGAVLGARRYGAADEHQPTT